MLPTHTQLALQVQVVQLHQRAVLLAVVGRLGTMAALVAMVQLEGRVRLVGPLLFLAIRRQEVAAVLVV